MDKPTFSAFEESWKHLSDSEIAEGKRLLVRYLETVIQIADEMDDLTDDENERTISLSYE